MASQNQDFRVCWLLACGGCEHTHKYRMVEFYDDMTRITSSCLDCGARLGREVRAPRRKPIPDLSDQFVALTTC